MHLLASSSPSLDGILRPVDLGPPPGDIAVLSFADSDLAGLAAAWAVERAALPSVRLAQLRDLKHPMSVDLWIERVGRPAQAIVVRLRRVGPCRDCGRARHRARAAAGRGSRRSAPGRGLDAAARGARDAAALLPRGRARPPRRLD